MQYSNNYKEFVTFDRIRQRVLLPWKPEDLRENFIVLRRRIGRTEQYLEKDLRVRRNLLRTILLFLTKRGNWRPGHGEETLHMWCEALSSVFNRLLAKDGILTSENGNFEVLTG